MLQLCQSASNTAASDKSQHAHVAPQGRRRPARLHLRALAFAAGSGEGAAAETSFYGCSPGSRRHGVQDRSRPACLLIRARATGSMTTTTLMAARPSPCGARTAQQELARQRSDDLHSIACSPSGAAHPSLLAHLSGAAHPLLRRATMESWPHKLCQGVE